MKNKLNSVEPDKNVIPKSRIFAIDVSWVLVAMITDLGIGFLLRVILGNYFGAEGLGAYTMVLVIYLLASMIGGIGIPVALVKYIAEYKEKKSKLHALVSCGFINSLILGLILAAIMFAISDLLESIFNIPQLSELLKIIALIFPFLLINNTLIGVLNGLRKMKLYAFAQIFRRATILIFTFVLVSFGFGVAGAVWALVIPALLTTILLLLVSKDYLYLRISGYIKTTKLLVSFGSKAFLTNTMNMINTRADMLLIGYFLMAPDVGIYAAAVMFVRLIMTIPQAVQRITYPAISELWAKKSHKAIENMINKCMKYSFVLLAAFGILLAFFAKDIIKFIYPSRPEFLSAILPLHILILAFVFRGAVTSVGGTFGSIGKPEISLYLIIFITIINISLNVILIPLYGISGAAVATSFSFIILTCIGIHLTQKLLKIKIYLDWFIKVGLISIVIYVLILFLEGFINHFIAGFIGIILYFVMLIITKTIGKDDWRLFKKILNFK